MPKSTAAAPRPATPERIPTPTDLGGRTDALLAALDERILVLDGATGTGLQSLELSAADFGGEDLDGCNENLVFTRPDAVESLHAGYLEAGADVVETNTFGATPLVLAEYGLADQAFEINRLAAKIARQAAAQFDVPGRPRFVCGSMGPTTKAISVTGGVTFPELVEHYRVEAMGLMAGGADYLLVETCQDTRNMKAALLAIETSFAACGWRLPVAASVTIEMTGTMLAGQDAEALAVSLRHVDLLYLGLNCATGPAQMTDPLRTLAEVGGRRVGCVPNAGLPDENGLYQEGPAEFVKVFSRFLDAGWLNVVGGCCGTTHEHVAALAELVRGRRPREVRDHSRAMVSGIDAVELTEDNRPLLVGERTNVLGSRKFKRLVAAGDWEAATEIARAQVRGGAQIVDVCMQDPDRDEMSDVVSFLDRANRMIKVPLMIDTTDPEVMEAALTWCQGKSILNSINLEDGLSRFERVVPMAQRFGAALVVGLIDEVGMAVSVERKLEVARRSFDLLTTEYDVRPEDIWWDALVFPCGTGDATYLGSAGATIEAIQRLREELPGTKTVLGVSNVSFGLPPAGREVLNSVFLYHATRAGLDAAIVNTEGLARYPEIPDEERSLAEALLELKLGDVENGERAVAEFTAHFRGLQTAVVRAPLADLPVDERLARGIVEGTKEGLIESLDEALADSRWPEPLDIINGPLMTGMGEVGRLFNANQLIVAEVLQSAEVMKAAVGHLEQFMDRAEGDAASRGRVILATVKGDVHDIGKNLVDIILSNNGFEVINLGIKVTSERLVEAAKEHRPDVIGLSGLLVKSAHQMVISAGDLREAGIDAPLLVGGAALTRRFTHKKIAPAYGALCTYAGDAMTGLSLVERLTDDERRPELEAEIESVAAEDRDGDSASGPTPAVRRKPVSIRRDLSPLAPPDCERHVETLDLDAVWALINPQMLYGKHLGLRGSVAKLRAEGDSKLAKLDDVLDEIKTIARDGGMTARAVWRFYPARAVGETLELTDPETGAVAAAWELPRQAGEGLCLTDFVLPAGDHVALLVTTAGDGVRERAEAWKLEGEYLKSHAWSALALESAEAAAELVHRNMRAAWGFADPDDLSPQDLFSARYQGKRYSFGYPACPDLGGQGALFAALSPADIGVELTEGDMMEPEASVSALVFHHPDARYFGA